jgi:glycosyltransferase involved in cell wall biosynthesis
VKILVLNYEYPPVGGGGGRACADLCRELVARGNEIRVITSHAVGLPFEEEIDGYRVTRMPTGRVDYSIASFVSMARFILSGFFPGLRAIRKWKPDILHVHFAVPTGVLGWVLSKLSGVPYVLTAHLGDVPGGVPSKTERWFRYLRPFTPPIWKRASAVIAVSRYTKTLAQENYEVSIRVIPNGTRIALKEDDPSRVTLQDPPTVVFAGRFQPQKNLTVLVDSLAQLQELDWRCLLIGDGPQRQTLEELIEKWSLGKRIQITGWIDSDEVWDLLGEGDILAMPSLSEGLPVVGIHALAQGTAIVAYEAGGLIDLVEDGVNGRICQIGDQECFRDGLRWCLEDGDRLRALKQASRKIAEQFDIARIAQQYERVFHEASNQ